MAEERHQREEAEDKLIVLLENTCTMCLYLGVGVESHQVAELRPRLVKAVHNSSVVMMIVGSNVSVRVVLLDATSFAYPFPTILFDILMHHQSLESLSPEPCQQATSFLAGIWVRSL